MKGGRGFYFLCVAPGGGNDFDVFVSNIIRSTRVERSIDIFKGCGYGRKQGTIPLLMVSFS